MTLYVSSMALGLDEEYSTWAYYDMVYVEAIEGNVIEDPIPIREIHKPLCDNLFSTGTTISIFGSLLYALPMGLDVIS